MRDCWNIISYLLEMNRQLPNCHDWRFHNSDAFEERVRSARDATQLNQIYWSDQARNLEAYSCMVMWRGVELLAPAVASLNARQTVAAAVLSRPFLELVTSAIINANNIAAAVADLNFTGSLAVVSSDFEERVVKMIWGTRIGETSPPMRQVNILTLPQELTKNPNAKELIQVYEYLCDAAHPNFIGNMRFWSHVESTDKYGSELRVLSRRADVEGHPELVNKVLWSLGWSSVCVRNAVEINQASVAQLLQKLRMPTGARAD